jgi:hypothetical protein
MLARSNGQRTAPESRLKLKKKWILNGTAYNSPLPQINTSGALRLTWRLSNRCRLAEIVQIYIGCLINIF